MKPLRLLVWIAVGVVGALLLAWAYPQAVPFAPRQWQISAEEAEAIALERFLDLGEEVPHPYVVTRLSSDAALERRLQLQAPAVGIERLRSGALADRVICWDVVVYPRGARPREWAYRARIGLDGRIFTLQLRPSEDASDGVMDPEEGRRRADYFLVEGGVRLEDYLPPEARTLQLSSRTDLILRYRRAELELGERFPYGLEVRFAGPTLTGFQIWFDDPQEGTLQAVNAPFDFLQLGRLLAVLVLLPLVAFPFLRRYHAGEIGIRRGLQIGALVLLAGSLLMIATAGPFSEGTSTGALTRRQTTWMYGFWMVGFLFFPLALASFLSWSVGESQCRARWSGKLAAFDALFQGSWLNATVARSMLRGVSSGLMLAGLLAVAGMLLRSVGVWPIASYEYSTWVLSSHWAGLVILLFFGAFATYAELFGRLFLLPLATRRLGRVVGGAATAVIGGLLCWGPGLWVYSVFGFLTLSVLAVGGLVILFLECDLLTSLGASAMAAISMAAFPLLAADDSWLQAQGWLAVLGASVPLLISIRHIGGGKEFEYRYEDVPPHVRRIAQRERQKVELETARRIQGSILPDLPSELAGVRLAHAYLPATEVGGDFYDVIALEDGRLAVAVGDVAGHGVSSGLVMAMAKSALTVQVSFDPAVEAVFATLNRMIFRSARKRLLTTLCYVLLDPRERRVSYASAGHLFPYRVSPAGRVQALESVSYPLGVRDPLEIAVREARLEAGESLFLFSDGVVESRRQGSDEQFGFERLERSLERHSSDGVKALRDGVLADLADFTAGDPREDDLTVLVLQVPQQP